MCILDFVILVSFIHDSIVRDRFPLGVKMVLSQKSHQIVQHLVSASPHNPNPIIMMSDRAHETVQAQRLMKCLRTLCIVHPYLNHRFDPSRLTGAEYVPLVRLCVKPRISFGNGAFAESGKCDDRLP